MRIDLSVRRLYCENPACPKTTFAEQIEGLTVRYQRRTPALQRIVVAVATALAGRAGARLLLHLHQVLSWATLLNVLMAVPDPPAPVPEVLAVDDFALRRSYRYGTLLVDAHTHLPIEVWDTSEGEPLTAWLRAHPGVRAVCRDGSVVFRGAISTGAPDAIQISDRFHLWQNLGRKVREVVAAHRSCLTEQPADGATLPPPPDGRAAERARRAHAAVHALLDQGVSIRAIARRLGLDRNAVRRYARIPTWQQAVPTWPKRPGILDPYRSEVRQRWQEGEHSTTVLYREISARGFTGSWTTVCNYLKVLPRAAEQGTPPPAPPPSVLQVTRWMTARPEALDEDRRTALQHLLERCPELATVYDRIRAFADLLTHKRAEQLDEWITHVKADGIPAMAGYATGLAEDIDAVRAGVSMPYSSGAIEGRVTDLKLIKRQMAGRAGIPLLRKRVILVAHSRRTVRPRGGIDDPWATTGYENLG